jgi:hypothetical protein
MLLLQSNSDEIEQISFVQQKVNLSDLPESKDQVTGYTLFFLLVSPSTHLL